MTWQKIFSIQNLKRCQISNSKSITLYSSYSKIWCDVCFISSKSEMLWNLFIKIWPDEKCFFFRNLMRSETLNSKSNALFSLKSKSDVLFFFKSKSDVPDFYKSKFNTLYFLYSKSGASKISSIPNMTRCKNFNSKPDSFFFEVRQVVFFSGQLLTYRRNLYQNHFFKKLEKT